MQKYLGYHVNVVWSDIYILTQCKLIIQYYELVVKLEIISDHMTICMGKVLLVL